MKRYEVTFGIGFDKNHKPIEDSETKLVFLTHLAASRFGGYTLNYGSGGWINPKGRFVQEQSATFVLITDSSLVEDFAQYVRDAFNQESVLVTVVELNTARFV